MSKGAYMFSLLLKLINLFKSSLSPLTLDVTVCSNKEKVDSLRAILQKLFKRPVDIYDLSRSKKTLVIHHIEQEVIYV